MASETSWFAREQTRLIRDSPRTWSALQALIRHRVVVLVLIAGLGGGFAEQHTLGMSDTALYQAAGRQLLSSHGINVFANPAIQVGPLYLGLLGLLSLVAQLLLLPGPLVAGFVQAGLVTALCVHLVRDFAGRADVGSGPMRDIGIGASLICGPLAIVGIAGHFEEPLVAAFLLFAADRVCRGKDTAAVLWLIAASGCKLWGFLGVAILLAAGSPTAWLRRGALYAVGCIACYLPFFLWGTVNTFKLSWPVWPSATLGFFLRDQPFTYELRLLQSALVCAFTALLVWRLRSRPWLLPVMVIAARLLFDPEQIPYYWSALVLCLTIGAWAGVPVKPRLLWPMTTAGAFLALMLPYLMSGSALRVVHTAILVLVMGAVFLLAQRTRVDDAARV